MNAPKKFLRLVLVLILCLSITGCSTAYLYGNQHTSNSNTISVDTLFSPVVKNVITTLGNPHSSNSVTFGTDVLSRPIVHEIYNHEEQIDAKVLSVYNSVGNISISQSDNEKIKVVMQLIQTKNLRDITEKLDGLMLHPIYDNDVVYYEPLYSHDTNMGYWRWIRNYLNANGIEITFDIQIPSTIQEVRVYGEIGNITISDITARIQAQTFVGSIVGRNLTPLDTATFITNTTTMPLGAYGIDISFANIEAVRHITAGTTASDIRLNMPNDEYTIIRDNNISTKYAHSVNSDAQEEYIRERCLAPLEKINSVSEGTQIFTLEDKRIVRTVIVE